MSVDLLEVALDRARQRRRLPRPEQRRQLREGAGLTLADAATVLGVTPGAVSRWESGARAPRDPDRYVRFLEKLAREGLRP